MNRNQGFVRDDLMQNYVVIEDEVSQAGPRWRRERKFDDYLLKRAALRLLGFRDCHAQHAHQPGLPGRGQGMDVVKQILFELRTPYRDRAFWTFGDIVTKGQFELIQRNVKIHLHVV